MSKNEEYVARLQEIKAQLYEELTKINIVNMAKHRFYRSCIDNRELFDPLTPSEKDKANIAFMEKHLRKLSLDCLLAETTNGEVHDVFKEVLKNNDIATFLLLTSGIFDFQRNKFDTKEVLDGAKQFPALLIEMRKGLILDDAKYINNYAKEVCRIETSMDNLLKEQFEMMINVTDKFIEKTSEEESAK